MISVARLTMMREWSRFLPAVLAVCFCGVLVSIQLALLDGIFQTVSVYIDRSSADLWVGSPNTLSIDLGQNISSSVQDLLLTNSEVQRVESILWIPAELRRENGPLLLGQLIGIGTDFQSMMFADLLPMTLREKLKEPESVLIDISLASRLHILVGQFLVVNAHRVKVVGVSTGLASIGGANIIASRPTAKRLDTTIASERGISYFLIRLKHAVDASIVRDALKQVPSERHFDVWTSAEFSQRSRKYWLFETGAGLGFAFSSLLGLLIGAIITNQTLKALIRGASREFATLRALGVPRRALYCIVLEQAGWVGLCGAFLTCCATAFFVSVAEHMRVLIVAPVWSYAGTAVLVLAVALISGALSLRTLSLAEPVRLLR